MFPLSGRVPLFLVYLHSSVAELIFFMTQTLKIRTARRTELRNVTAEIEKLVGASGGTNGTCHLYVPHTTAGVLVNEGYDPDVARDMGYALDRLVPHDEGFRHAEGNSDSHIEVALVGTSQSVWIENGCLALGQWQQIFFAEFDGPRTRELRVKIVSQPSAGLPTRHLRCADHIRRGRASACLRSRVCHRWRVGASASTKGRRVAPFRWAASSAASLRLGPSLVQSKSTALLRR
jgi:secondary thiamine-phosphate synthase enzyme